jgi:predicted RecA/RadA family phage recombinase
MEMTMATNFVQPGNIITLTAPAVTGCKSGDLIVVGAFAGVAAYDAGPGEEVECTLEGVWELPKAPGQLTEGQPVYWDAGPGAIAGAPAAGLFPIGAVVRAAGTNDTTVRVRLNGTTVTAIPGT